MAGSPWGSNPTAGFSKRPKSYQRPDQPRLIHQIKTNAAGMPSSTNILADHMIAASTAPNRIAPAMINTIAKVTSIDDFFKRCRNAGF